MFKINYRYNKLLTGLIITIICFTAPVFVEAASIKVKPPEVKIETSSDFFQKEIIIENPGSNVALFEAYLDNFYDFVKIKPESFILEGGKSEKVILEVRGKEAGVFSGMISVVAKPLSEREFKANAGVKIPLEIRILEKSSEVWLASVLNSIKNNQWLIYILVIVVILSLMSVLFLRKKKQSLPS